MEWWHVTGWLISPAVSRLILRILAILCPRPSSRPPHPVAHYVVISGQHNYNLPFTYMQTNMPISLFTEAQYIHNKQALIIKAAIDIYR